MGNKNQLRVCFGKIKDRKERLSKTQNQKKVSAPEVPQTCCLSVCFYSEEGFRRATSLVGGFADVMSGGRCGVI